MHSQPSEVEIRVLIVLILLWNIDLGHLIPFPNARLNLHWVQSWAAERWLLILGKDLGGPMAHLPPGLWPAESWFHLGLRLAGREGRAFDGFPLFN